MANGAMMDAVTIFYPQDSFHIDLTELWALFWALWLENWPYLRPTPTNDNCW